MHKMERKEIFWEREIHYGRHLGYYSISTSIFLEFILEWMNDVKIGKTIGFSGEGEGWRNSLIPRQQTNSLIGHEWMAYVHIFGRGLVVWRFWLNNWRSIAFALLFPLGGFIWDLANSSFPWGLWHINWEHLLMYIFVCAPRAIQLKQLGSDAKISFLLRKNVGGGKAKWMTDGG